MARVETQSTQTDAGSPIDEDLMDQGLRLNDNDHETRIGILEAGGGGGGGGAEYDEVFAAEDILGETENPKAVCLSQKKCLDIASADSYLDINEGAGEISVKCVAADKVFLIHDLSFDNDTEDAHDLMNVIETALNASALTLTYTVTYSKTTRKITIAASSNFSLLWNTGTNAVHSLGIALGFDVVSDDTSATSHTADYVLENDNNTLYKNYAFVSKTDASLVVKSRNFDGFVDTDVTKGDTCTVKQFVLLDTFTHDVLTPAEKYYSLSSEIIITDDNKYIDFQEGAGELNATLTTGRYSRGSDSDNGYNSLCAEIKSAMETAGALTFNVRFNKNTNKFIIGVTSGTIDLLCKTGTHGSDNTDDHAFTALGFDDTTDKSSLQDQTSDNVIPTNTGKIGLATDGQIVGGSVYIGKTIAKTGQELFVEKNYTQSDYDPIYTIPSDFLATPGEKDYGAGANLGRQAENSSGQGVGVVASPYTATYYKLQYKTGKGMPWIDASTTINYTQSGTQNIADNWNGASGFNYAPRVGIDENGHAVLACLRTSSSGGTYDAFTYYSNDLDNWTLGSKLTTGSNFFISGLAMREGKAVVLINKSTGDASYTAISDDSGSGYASWTLGSSLSTDYFGAQYSFVFIQYFPNETGIDKHRIVVVGSRYSDYRWYYTYAKGDGTSEASGAIVAANLTPHTATIDQGSTGNRISVHATTVSSATVWAADFYQAESSEDYNAGVLTFDAHSSQDLNSGGSAIDAFSGFTPARCAYNLAMNTLKRSVLINDYAYTLMFSNSNPSSKVSMKLLYSKDITSGTWETPINIGQTSGNCQNGTIEYIAATNGLLVTWKYMPTAALSAVLTNGQIFSRYIQINGDGSVSLYDIEQIDGGEAEAGFQGYVTPSSSPDSVSISWEHNNGSYDVIRSNNFI